MACGWWYNSVRYWYRLEYSGNICQHVCVAKVCNFVVVKESLEGVEIAANLRRTCGIAESEKCEIVDCELVASELNVNWLQV